jgi:hypothetical protein
VLSEALRGFIRGLRGFISGTLRFRQRLRGHLREQLTQLLDGLRRPAQRACKRVQGSRRHVRRRRARACQPRSHQATRGSSSPSPRWCSHRMAVHVGHGLSALKLNQQKRRPGRCYTSLTCARRAGRGRAINANQGRGFSLGRNECHPSVAMNRDHSEAHIAVVVRMEHHILPLHGHQ